MATFCFGPVLECTSVVELCTGLPNRWGEFWNQRRAAAELGDDFGDLVDDFGAGGRAGIREGGVFVARQKKKRRTNFNF